MNETTCTRCGWPKKDHGTEQEDTTSCPVPEWWTGDADAWDEMDHEFTDEPVRRVFANDQERTEFARDWVFGRERAGVERPIPTEQVVNAICDADDTRPVDGIDRPTWGGLRPNDRMEIARFFAFLKVAGPLPPVTHRREASA